MAHPLISRCQSIFALCSTTIFINLTEYSAQSCKCGRLDLYDGSSIFSQHQDGKLIYFVYVHSIAESAGDVRIAVFVEVHSFRPNHVHLAIRLAFLTLVQNFQPP